MKRFLKSLFIVCIFFLCLGIVNAEVISTIELTSNIDSVPVHGVKLFLKE